MIYANKNNEKIMASPSNKAICPLCDKEVIAKCGQIKVWHWAHKADDCDHWHEPESQWHLDWKSQIRKDCVEVKCQNHRADIKSPTGMVVELQNSNMPMEIAQEREEFYDSMVWLVNAENMRIYFNRKCSKTGNIYYTFKLKWAKSFIKYATKPVILDLGELFVAENQKPDGYGGPSEEDENMEIKELFKIEKIQDNNWGWGYMKDYDWFFTRYLYGLKI